MRWATRPRCHVDRAACAWLIRRFVDPEDVPSDAIPFDMRGVELTHHDGDCTFETMLRRYEFADPVLWEIAGIVHEDDLDDGRYDAPEARRADPRALGRHRRRRAAPTRGTAVRRPVRAAPSGAPLRVVTRTLGGSAGSRTSA
jgi:hypothetical protein